MILNRSHCPPSGQDTTGVAAAQPPTLRNAAAAAAVAAAAAAPVAAVAAVAVFAAEFGCFSCCSCDTATCGGSKLRETHGSKSETAPVGPREGPSIILLQQQQELQQNLSTGLLL